MEGELTCSYSEPVYAMPMLQKLIPKSVCVLCEALQCAGGHVWLVGGCVRDLSLGLNPKDWDVEVYGLEENLLNKALNKLGHCEYVGKQFGVCKLWFDGLEFDVALPRTEVKSGVGHKNFTITSNPFIAPEKATLRRDFTMNAMMFDPLTQELLDFHGGLSDLTEKKLRHVSLAFVEDPLRPLRAMQLAARFQLKLTPETAALCQGLLNEAATLPASRIWQEWVKWAKSDSPSCGLVALRDMGWLCLYPELESLVGCPQDVYWHPEGDVWVHTCLVVDAAAALRGKRGLTAKEQVLLMFAALCHDFGKPKTTFTDESGRVCAPQHDEVGKGYATSFLHRIAAPKYVKPVVLRLVQDHMAHLHEKLTIHAIAKLAYRLSPVSIELWEVLAQADASGRAPAAPSRPALAWLKQADMLGIRYKKASPIVTGKDLLRWGLKPSPQWGKVIQLAYEAQLDGLFEEKKGGKEWVFTKCFTGDQKRR